jgi:hypothetical protein
MQPAAAITPKTDPSWLTGEYGPIRPKTLALKAPRSDVPEQMR